MTKKLKLLRKIKDRCDKNQGYLERNLSLGMTKIKIVKKN